MVFRELILDGDIWESLTDKHILDKLVDAAPNLMHVVLEMRAGGNDNLKADIMDVMSRKFKENDLLPERVAPALT
ncbi:hypothetical protein PG993_005782 [Apiospora rasikravindrae]|uniref:Uncharacterized protein n=1 Tax=Apiospora rasikravindrae TaxID=990691 RepID=A0ABR1T9S4_9PEZI